MFVFIFICSNYPVIDCNRSGFVLRKKFIRQYSESYMVEEVDADIEIRFQTGDYDKLANLSRDILNDDDRAVKLPADTLFEFSNFFDELLEIAEEYVVGLYNGNDENDFIEIICINDDPHNYGAIIIVANFGIYFTTGGSAVDMLVECEMKPIGYTTKGTCYIYRRAVGGATYLTADMVYPESNFKLKRFQKDIEEDIDQNKEE